MTASEESDMIIFLKVYGNQCLQFLGLAVKLPQHMGNYVLQIEFLVLKYI